MKFILLPLFVALFGCAQQSQAHYNDDNPPSQEGTTQATPPPPVKLENKMKESTTVTIKGTVVYKTMEGGFIAIDADNGDKFLPYGLAEEYAQPGLKVIVTGTIQTGVMTIQQYGRVLKVESVKVIGRDNSVQPNTF